MKYKIAAMTPAKARALEALAGLVAVGAPAGYVAGTTWQPKDPRYWVKDDKVYGRDLTKAEKKQFIKRVALVSLLAGSVGAGGSLGFSKYRRGAATKADAKKIEDLMDKYFANLKPAQAIQTRRSSKAILNVNRVKAQTIDPVEAVLGGTDMTAVRAAEQHAKDEAWALLNLSKVRASPVFSEAGALEYAKKTRDVIPWGGPFTRKISIGGQEITIPTASRAEGVLIDHIGPQHMQFEPGDKGRVQIVPPKIEQWIERTHKNK